MKLEPFYSVLLSAIVVFTFTFSSPLYAQNIEHESLGLEIIEKFDDSDKVIVNELVGGISAADEIVTGNTIIVSALASPAIEVQVSSVVELVESTQNTLIAPGVCLVINNYLADFCRQYPNDTSCNFQ